MTELEVAIKTTNQEILKKLEEYLVISSHPENKVIEAMRYSSMQGGKRLRPLLVMESAKIFDVPTEYALNVAVAIEMVHCYSLIHDDLPAMDDDDMRRGMPTCHKKYDEATAILAGDGLLTKAFEVLSNPKTHPSAEVRCDLISALSKAAGDMVLGQTIDMLPEEQRQNTLNFITRLQTFKTGALINFACVAGAIMGKKRHEDFATMEKYAQNLGLAFQITDDILDVEGDEKLVGKTLGKDEKSNKATFVSLLGLDGAKAKAKELIDEAISVVDKYDATTLQAIAHFVLSRNH